METFFMNMMNCIWCVIGSLTTQNLCSIGLRALEENGFVFRHYQAVIPPALTYGIADRMKDIEKVLAQLEDLSRKWKTQGREGTQASRTGSSSLP
jgi:DNA-binding HxlR family transcriptional regulator